jgi:hypothetical protein
VQFVRSSGGISSSNSGTVIAETDPSQFVGDQWNTLRIKGKLSATVGELMARVNAGPIFDFGAALNTGAGPIDFFGYTSDNAATQIRGIAVDDIVIENQSSVWLPECRIQPLQPNADGGTLNLVPSTGTSHEGVVDELTCSTADYLSGSADGEYDLLGCEDISVEPASIVALKAIGWAEKTDAGSRAWNLGLVSGVTTDDGPDLSLTTDPGYSERTEELDFDAASAWVQASINAVELKPTVVVP